MFDQKNILVTGGSGFIGTNLIKRLLRENANIIAVTHANPPKIDSKKIHYVSGDLRDASFCDEIMTDIDYVFMCAANTSGAAVMENAPLTHLTPNIIMNLTVLESAYRHNVKKFLFISSNTVYPASDNPMAENDAGYEFFEKYHIVGWMKRFSEVVCEIYAKKIKIPLDIVIVRPGNVYGPYDDFHWETSHVLPALIRKVVERHNPLIVWGDGSDLKDFIFVDDFIEGLLKAIRYSSSFDIINLASGKQYELKDVLATIMQIENYSSVEVKYDISKPCMIPKRVIDVNYAREKIGFSAETSLIDGLIKTINWYKSEQISKQHIEAH